MKTRLDVDPAVTALRQLRLRGALIEQMSDLLIVLDLSGRIVECNPVARRLFGIGSKLGHLDDFRARFDCWREGGAEALQKSEEPLQLALEGKDSSPAIYHVVFHESGRSLWIRARAMSLRDEGGKVVGALSIGSDITAEHQSRELALDRDAQYGAILRAIPDHLLKLDQHGTILAYKPAHVVEPGIKPSQYVGRRLSEVVPAELAASSMDALGRAFAEQRPTNYEFEIQREGMARCFEARLAPINRRELIAIIRDISDRRASERERAEVREELASITHLAHVSEMASTMAHELNQPLSAINLYARGCMRRLDSDAEDVEGLRDALAQVVEQSQRAAEIIRRIRDFTMQGIGGFEVRDIHPLIERVAHIARYEALERSVEIQLLTAAKRTRLLLDRSQIQQALLQLVRNAIEASSSAPHGERLVQISTNNHDAENLLELRVQDVGPGVAPELTEEIFKLFYTTKRNGVGLGLPIARSIATAHGGRLVVESPAGGGAVFCLRLPLAKEEGGNHARLP